MKKNVYIARSTNGFEDTCKAFFDKDEATASARSMFEHLTARERREETVTVETYLVTVDEDDERSAEQLYKDLLDEESPEIMNIPDYDEITGKDVDRYEAHEIALHLIEGGWESSDKDQFTDENSRGDSQNVLTAEAIDMIFDEIERIEYEIRERYHIDMDGFGQDCPENWEEIAQALNDEIDKLPYNGDESAFADAVADLWERYCSNDPSTASIPRPVEGETVVNQFGVEIDFETAANLMDDEIREQLHDEGIEDRQEFFDQYAVKHLQKFGEEWECDKPNPQY